MLRKLLKDPTLLILLLGNLWCIYYYTQYTQGFNTIVWIYWCQSVIIGLFNALDLFTLQDYDPGDMRLNDKPITAANKGCLPLFFMVHYGIFHLVYFVFIAAKYHKGTDFQLILISIAVLLIEGIIAFRRAKQNEKVFKTNIGVMFFLPYLRIVPMHLMILVPAFLHITPSIVFLILKTGADLLFYSISKRFLYKKA